jgi:chemotaxis protein MotB
MAHARLARHRSRLLDEEEDQGSHERWLLTYADMITLLMVLFIVLFAISQIDQKKFDALHDGLAQSFGDAKVLNGGSGVLQGSTKQSVTPDQSQAAQQALAQQTQADVARRRQADSMRRVQNDITQRLGVLGLRDSVEFSTEPRGLVVNIVTDSVLFELGSATLRPEGRRVLAAITPPLSSLPNDLVIEGHTDNVPITGGRYPSNWELSAERATTVLRYLLTDHVKPSLVSAAGYADQRPLVPNDTTAHRTRNRRVAIVIAAPAASEAFIRSDVAPSAPPVPPGA